MTNTFKLKISSWIFYATGIATSIMGIIFLTLRPLVVLLPEDSRYTGLTSEQLKAIDPRLFSWIGMVFRSWGAFAVGLGIVIIMLTANAYKHRERWAWLTLAAVGLTSLLGFVVVNIFLKSDFIIILTVWLALYGISLWFGKSLLAHTDAAGGTR